MSPASVGRMLTRMLASREVRFDHEYLSEDQRSWISAEIRALRAALEHMAMLDEAALTEAKAKVKTAWGHL